MILSTIMYSNNIILSVIVVLSALQSITSSDINTCFAKVLRRTQNCSNDNLLYVTAPMGINSGLASEFNRYLIYSLLTAVEQNRRMGQHLLFYYVLLYIFIAHTFLYTTHKSHTYCTYIHTYIHTHLITISFGSSFSTLLVFLKSSRPWEYNCPELGSWACYLRFPCEGAGVEAKDLDFSKLGMYFGNTTTTTTTTTNTTTIP